MRREPILGAPGVCEPNALRMVIRNLELRRERATEVAQAIIDLPARVIHQDKEAILTVHRLKRFDTVQPPRSEP